MKLKKNKVRNVVPIFYACDENFIKYTIVSISSLIKNASKDRCYKIHILNTDISDNMKFETLKLKNDFCEIEFVDVKLQLEKIKSSLPLRDYYSKTTYYRFFISKIFTEYDKAIYIDSDTVVLGDISELYDKELNDNYLGACKEQVMVQTEVYGNYVEKVLGINRNEYFNAGVLLINCKEFRKKKVLEKFINLLNVYTFVVTQDQDYLNVICRDKVLWLDQCWNTEIYGEISVKESEIKILHYIMVSKPWHYKNCLYKEYFWNAVENSSVKRLIMDDLNNYTDQQRENDIKSCIELERIAKCETERIDTYFNLTKSKNPSRLKVLERIRNYELEKKFNLDVEDDPETKILLPKKVDYLGKKISSKIFTRIANNLAVAFYEKQIRKGNFIIKEVKGIENFNSVKSGAIITCNHFNAYDNYAIWRSIRNCMPKGKRLYKIIREGNFTNFKGLYGFFFRHCNTLPLSSNHKTMAKFIKSVSILLNRGEKILIYPEQAMWWNYKKPRPFKDGAFRFAVKNSVPIIPVFITMEGSGKFDSDGFEIQAYTVWFLPPIKTRCDLSDKENAEYLKNKNFQMWKELYEKVYNIPLDYGN